MPIQKNSNNTDCNFQLKDLQKNNEISIASNCNNRHWHFAVIYNFNAKNISIFMFCDAFRRFLVTFPINFLGNKVNY